MRSGPIVAVKSGRTSAGARAAASHTGALLEASDRTVDALFRQAGVIRTDTLSELFDVVSLLAHQPVPAGRRVGIVTNAGGPGILCADACGSEGLTVVALSPHTQHALQQMLPQEASTANPVDTLAAVSPDDYRNAITVVGASDEVDAIIAIYIPPAGDTAATTAAIRAAADDLDRRVPLLSVVMSEAEEPSDELRSGRRVPTYAFPENAVRALAHAADYGAWRDLPQQPASEPPGIDHDTATALLAQITGDAPEGRWLTPDEVTRLFACYGIALVPSHVVATSDEAVAAARSFMPGSAHHCRRPAVPSADVGSRPSSRTEASAVRSRSC